ncbi:MAG: DUF1823 family protein [Leptolyngbyaceae cyanobacterium CRU_2_3]|nr:DUF1823 family protein [Leptolyngbyaceae cyanobacterium CRU_2_3]
MADLPPLTESTFWAILQDQIEDATVNQLVWYHLGYRYDDRLNRWDATAVKAEWQSDYPEPPDFIESRPASVKLTRSIPQEHKQLLKENLGFEGYKINELVPRKTRRATIVSWLLSYRQIANVER